MTLGAKLLAACGYKGDGGLGAREDGAIEPVEVRVKRDRAGIGSAKAKTYAVVGAVKDVQKQNQKGATTTTTYDADEDDADADDATKRMKKMKTKIESERAVREQRRGNAIARGLYRAFKEDEKAGDVNPLLRKKDIGNGNGGGSGGMSASNPLRRFAR